MSRHPDLRLYGILDPAQLEGRDPVDCALAAARGGATLLQLRDKRYAARPVITLARRLVAALRPLGVPLIVDDRVDVALAAGAAGVHLGREDMDPEDARSLLGPARWIGVTIHHAHEIDALRPGVADYAGLGPVFPTRSKDPGDPPLGPDGLGRLIGHLRTRFPDLPVCAIAGIDADRIAPVIDAGVDGIAVLSSLFRSPDIETAAGRLRSAVDLAIARRAAP